MNQGNMLFEKVPIFSEIPKRVPYKIITRETKKNQTNFYCYFPFKREMIQIVLRDCNVYILIKNDI